MRVVFKSRILDTAEHFMGRLRDLFADSRILSCLSLLYPRLERLFRHGRFQRLTNEESNRRCWQYRTRRIAQKHAERSFFLGLWQDVTGFFCALSVGTLGSFGVLYGGFSAVLWLLRASDARRSVELIACLLLVVLSVPLLSSRRALLADLRESRTVGAFLLGFCGLSPIFSDEVGRERHWLSLFLAFCLSVTGIWLSPLYLWGAIGTLLLVILLFCVPELCTLGTLFFLPFLNLLSHPTLALSLLSLLSVLTWLWKAILGRRCFSFGALDAVVVLSAVSLLCGGTVGAASAASAVTSISMILFYFPVRNLLVGGLWRRRATAAIRLSGAAVGGFGVLQYLLGYAELRWVDTTRFSDIGGRVVSCFSNPNILAVYLLLIAPFFLQALMEGARSARAKMVDGVGFSAVTLALILTWSRGAWLGFLVEMTVFFLAYSRRSAGALLLSSIPATALLGFLPHSIVNRFSSMTSLSETSIRYRIYTWRGVLRMIADHRWGIGVGSDAFARVYPSYAVSGAEGAVHTHQILLRVTSEQGVAGLLILLLLLVLLLLCFLHALKFGEGERRQDAITASAALLGTLVMGLFDDVWYHFGMLCLFFAVAAMLASAGKSDGEVL